MSKKRRTKQQKIIASLKRQLKQQKVVYTRQVHQQSSKETKPLITKKSKFIKKQPKALLFSYDPKLIKKDLIKTLLLSFIFIILILTLKFSRLEALFFRQ